jgi:hypothetical protein
LVRISMRCPGNTTDMRSESQKTNCLGQGAFCPKAG